MLKLINFRFHLTVPGRMMCQDFSFICTPSELGFKMSRMTTHCWWEDRAMRGGLICKKNEVANVRSYHGFLLGIPQKMTLPLPFLHPRPFPLLLLFSISSFFVLLLSMGAFTNSSLSNNSNPLKIY